MECPACRREMRKGYFIDREAPIQWIPEGSKPPLFKTEVAEGALPLAVAATGKATKQTRFTALPADLL